MDIYSYQSRQQRRAKRRRQVYRRRFALIIVLILIVLLIVKLKRIDAVEDQPENMLSVEDINENNAKDRIGSSNEQEDYIPEEDLVLPTEEAPMPEYKGTIVVDPGHGGRDPGMVGINGELEKDINLSIALKLRDYLEDNGYKVIMTREGDYGLYSESDSNKKMADLEKRVGIINQGEVDVAIIIHQNSFSQESVKGAQVFYHQNSQEGEILSNIMQEQIKMTVQTDNKRFAAPNTSYYILRKTNCPVIIIECGFLSNNEEAKLLTDENYQDKMAEGIYMGLDTYIKARQ